MKPVDLEKYELEPHRQAIEAAALACLIGLTSESECDSYFGGLPKIDPGFTWPMKDGIPLNFIGQLKCSDIDLWPRKDGYLLFFYDNRHWGDSAKDVGYAIVLHQTGKTQATLSDLPEKQVSSFFGLWKTIVKPKVYQKVNVTFKEGESFPSLDRNHIALGNSKDEECYLEFLQDMQATIQVGGYPSPVQYDGMERECAKTLKYGDAEDWQLLLQVSEVGDMTWGDAGTLYWFIHKEDLIQGKTDRVWMIMQCY